jgi:hypothetical protein
MLSLLWFGGCGGRVSGGEVVVVVGGFDCNGGGGGVGDMVVM